MNMLDSFKKYFGKESKVDDVEKANGIINRFASGSPYTDSEIVYVLSQIKQDSPDDAIIKLLKQSGRSVEFKKEAIRIKEKYEKAMKDAEFFRQTYDLAVMKISNTLHEDRDVPLSDEFFLELRKINEGIQNSFFTKKEPRNIVEKFVDYISPFGTAESHNPFLKE